MKIVVTIGLILWHLVLSIQRPPALPVAVAPINPYETKSGQRVQFVVLSFDGSLSLDMWEATRAFARELTRAGTPLHFTYFISGVYLLGPEHARVYQPPALPAGSSAIGFSAATADVPRRIQEINDAVAEGNEIGSHANGHFRGGVWSKSQWEQEFRQFNHLIFDWQTNNEIATASGMPHLNITERDIVGFRSPLLSKNEFMYQVLPEFGYKYDGSGVTNDSTVWPTQNEHGTWLIPLANIPLAGTRSEVISMDYNFYSAQTQARDIVRRGTPLWQKYEQQMLDSYEAEFQKNYTSTRAPVIVGHHFSTWNDAAYWEAMKAFARDVCSRPEVRCGTYKELVQYLEWVKRNPSQK